MKIKSKFKNGDSVSYKTATYTEYIIISVMYVESIADGKCILYRMQNENGISSNILECLLKEYKKGK